MATATKKAAVVKSDVDVDVDEDVAVEVAEEEKGPVITTGITTQLADNFHFSAIDTSLSPEERAPLVRAALLASQAAEGVLEIIQGELLYEANRNEYWKGYSFSDATGTERMYASWDEFCDGELGLKRRTAYKRIELYDVYVNQLELDADTLRGIQWSKAGLVSKLITPETAEPILDAINNMSFRQVEQFAKELKNGEDVAEARATVLAPKALTDESGVGIEGGDGTTSSSASDPGEVMKTFSAKLAPAQLENVQAALAVAASITGSDSNANNLDVICGEYLASNAANVDGGEDAGLEQVARIIEMVQTNFGVELSIVAMPDSDGGA